MMGDSSFTTSEVLFLVAINDSLKYLSFFDFPHTFLNNGEIPKKTMVFTH